MTISADSLIDRIYLKSQLKKWRFLALVFAVLAIFALVKHRVPVVIEEDYIARLTISGIIGDDQKTYDLISNIADDKKAKAVIVWLDTPGGSAVGGEEVYLHLRDLSAKKPVVAVMRSVSASAGYMAALGADYIFAREGTITGSIGVLIETAEVTELAKKLGILPIAIKSSPLKASPSPFEKSTPEAEKVLHEMIMDFYNHFVDITAERRKLPRSQVLILADGRVYSGKRAVENKLVDAIGGEKDAIDWLVKNRSISPKLLVSDVEFESEGSFIEKILKDSIGNFWQKSIVGLDGLSAIWHPKVY
jgi:protease-4